MKSQKAVVVIGAITLTLAAGCSSLHKSVSGSAWSETGAREELQQERNSAPGGDWNIIQPEEPLKW